MLGKFLLQSISFGHLALFWWNCQVKPRPLRTQLLCCWTWVLVFACLAVGKMATDWQGLALQQAELISNRVREVLSLGVKFLKTELGVELDVKPELYPSWVILSTVFIGLFVVALLTWVAACSVGRKRRPIVSENSDVVKASVTKTIKTEEPKKRNKKKSSDKVCPG